MIKNYLCCCLGNISGKSIITVAAGNYSHTINKIDIVYYEDFRVQWPSPLSVWGQIQCVQQFENSICIDSQSVAEVSRGVGHEYKIMSVIWP